MNIAWAQEAKYLGIYIVNAHEFKYNFYVKKAKYYRAADAILGKLGKANNPCVTLQWRRQLLGQARAQPGTMVSRRGTL